MHSNTCVATSFSDVFPALSLAEPPCPLSTNSLIMNGNSDLSLKMKYIGMGVSNGTSNQNFASEDRAELAVIHFNGRQLTEFSGPVRMRLIGGVSRETCGLLCLPTRNSPSVVSRITTTPSTDAFADHESLLNNRKQIALSGFSKPDIQNGFSIQHRPITRSKALDLNLGQNGITSTSSNLFDICEPNSQPISNGDVFNERDQSIFGIQRVDNEADKMSSLGLGSWSAHRAMISNERDLQISSPKRLSIFAPLFQNHMLSSLLLQAGCQAKVWMKMEMFQPTGSYRIRGLEVAFNKFVQSGVTHIVCPCVDKIALSVVHVARQFGVQCTIVLPEGSDPTIHRRLLLVAASTRIVLFGSSWSDVHQRAELMVDELQSSSNSPIRLLHPFDNSDLWDGYESILTELPPETGQPDVIVIAASGGDLLAGIVRALWNRSWSSTIVVTAELESNGVLATRSRNGRPSAMRMGQRNWSWLQCHCVIHQVCSDSDVLSSLKQYYADTGMVVDPSTAAVLSVVYSGHFTRMQAEGRIPKPANVVLIIGESSIGLNFQQLADLDVQTASSSFGIDQVVNYPVMNGYASEFKRNPPLEEKAVGGPCSLSKRTIVNDDTISSKIRAVDTELNSDSSSLSPHDLVNFSKLLGPEPDSQSDHRD